MPTKAELKREKELIESIKTDAPRAFDQLYDYLSKVVFKKPPQKGVLLGVDLDDLINETSIRALEVIKRGAFNPQLGTLHPWLQRIATNLAIDHYRMATNPAERRISSRWAEDLESLLGEPEIEISFASDLTEQQIKSTLEAVADYYRACGGIGFEVKFDTIEIAVREPSVV